MHLLSSHPSRADLFDYAEMQERGAGRTSAAIAAHIEECERCAREVERVRGTIAVAIEADEVEPTREWRAETLLLARQERANAARAGIRVTWATDRRVVATGAAILLIASLSIVAVQHGNFDFTAIGETAATSSAAVFSLDVLRQSTPEEVVLAPAVLAGSDPASPWEASRRRAVQAWDAEIDEALEALESNPACARAATLVNTNRERLGETLKVLYVERSF